jgi:peptidyl-tRNA hydrolase, PTH2 family
MTEDNDYRQVKQVIVIRRDLKMRRGKEVAQGAHASMMWLVRRLERYGSGGAGTARVEGKLSEAESLWLNDSFRKVTCQVDTEAEIMALGQAALDAGLEAHVVTDSGLTEFNGIPTVTALAIGPDFDHLVDTVTGGLKLY